MTPRTRTAVCAPSADPAYKPRSEEIHGYFGLSYASWLCLPRTLLQSMPDEWQERFVGLLREYDQHWHGLPDGYLPREYRVQPTESGRLISWDNFLLPNYRRGRTFVPSPRTEARDE